MELTCLTKLFKNLDVRKEVALHYFFLKNHSWMVWGQCLKFFLAYSAETYLRNDCCFSQLLTERPDTQSSCSEWHVSLAPSGLQTHSVGQWRGESPWVLKNPLLCWGPMKPSVCIRDQWWHAFSDKSIKAQQTCTDGNKWLWTLFLYSI